MHVIELAHIKTQPHTYSKAKKLFIYKIIEMYIKHSLSEHYIRCSSHSFPSFICLLAGKCEASSHLSITRIHCNRTGHMGTGTRNRLRTYGLPLIQTDGCDVSGTDNMCYILIGLPPLHSFPCMCHSLISLILCKEIMKISQCYQGSICLSIKQ